MGADGPTPDREQAGGQPDQASEQPSSDGADWAELGPRALDPDFGRLLSSLPVAEASSSSCTGCCMATWNARCCPRPTGPPTWA